MWCLMCLYVCNAHLVDHLVDHGFRFCPAFKLHTYIGYIEVTLRWLLNLTFGHGFIRTTTVSTSCAFISFMIMLVKFSKKSINFFIRPSSVLWYGDVRPSVRHSFPHFSPTCFDILIWNFVYHFIFMHVRSSSNAINFRHFLQELCSFLTSNSYKYAVFRTFLLHALTYWVQILYMTLF